MTVQSPLPGTFILNLPPALGLLGADAFVIVQAGTTKRVPFSIISGAIAGGSGSTVTITSGATIGSPYQPPSGVSRVLMNKTVGAASYVQFLAASTYNGLPVLIKDLKGDAVTNNITITFTGGELADGDSTVVLNVSYGAVWVNPLPGGGGFYLTQA